MPFKKFVVACTMGAMLATSVVVPQTAEAASAITIKINDVTYDLEGSPAPQNIDGRVYVPLRLVSEGLGHSVKWDGSTHSVLIDSELTDIDDVASIYSSLSIYIDGEKLAIDTVTGVPYLTPEGYTMVPVRVVTEGLGATVDWNTNTQTVSISTGITSGGSTSPAPDVNWPEITLPDVTPSQPDSDTGTVDDNTPSVDAGLPQSAEEVTLRGASYCSLEQMQRYLDKMETTIRNRCTANGETFVPFPDNIAYQYYTISQKYNIRGDVALAQALLETGYFQYGNEVKPWQNNYCGLGAVGHTATEDEVANSLLTNINHNRAWLQVGIHGWIYDSVATGVEAHIQHLYSYATTASLPSGCELVDGRFNHGNRGVAQNLTDLNGKWAVPGNGYGENIYNNMLVEMMNS